MATKTLLRQPKQRLIYSQEQTMNFGSPYDNTGILNLFKSSASLSRSLRHAPSDEKVSLFKSSGDLIMNSSSLKSTTNPLTQSMPLSHNQNSNTTFLGNKASFKSAVSSSSKQIQIRNIIHDYTDMDVCQETYNILNALKTKKRSQNIDTLDDYEVWKTGYFNTTEDNVKQSINDLQSLLQNTKDEILSKFKMKDESLIPLNQHDIGNITQFYNNVIENRAQSITNTLNALLDSFTKCCIDVKNKVVILGRDLDLIGYLLEEEIKAITDEKELYITKLTECKKRYYTKIINEIRDSEAITVEESKHEYMNFILRWKNIKLNHFFAELKAFLASTEIVDNKERYDLIEHLKQDQMMIYEKRRALIFDKLFTLSYEDITTKKIEAINKELDDIYTEGEKIFINHIELLVKNSEDVQARSLEAIEAFKANVASVSYVFTKDNHNDKQYNDYDDIESIDELINKEIIPIINENKQNRTEYTKLINAYIDEYDDYTNNISSKMIAMYLSIGKLFDEHKKHFTSEERNYLFALAKATDNDDDFIDEKEKVIKGFVSKMSSSNTQEELDELLDNCFKVMDELEKEYRNYFTTMDELFTSHESIITKAFTTYEEKILQLFGYYPPDRKFEIEKRRNIENDFLIKKKEAEIAHEEALQAEEEAKNAEKQGKKAKAPTTKDKKGNKKGDEQEHPPREILSFKSKLNCDYFIDFTIEELIRHFLRNIIYNRDDDIFELKPKTPEELERLKKEKEEREQQEKEALENPKGKKPASRKGDKKNNSDANSQNATEIDFYTAFDPYKTDSNKVFVSPLSQTEIKLLSEENAFIEDNLVKGVCGLYEMLTNAIVDLYKIKVEEAKNEDTERREEILTELDLRLKLLAPKKGKIEVEEYDKRISELEQIEKKRKREEMLRKQKEEEERLKNGEAPIEEVEGEGEEHKEDEQQDNNNNNNNKRNDKAATAGNKK